MNTSVYQIQRRSEFAEGPSALNAAAQVAAVMDSFAQDHYIDARFAQMDPETGLVHFSANPIMTVGEPALPQKRAMRHVLNFVAPHNSGATKATDWMMDLPDNLRADAFNYYMREKLGSKKLLFRAYDYEGLENAHRQIERKNQGRIPNWLPAGGDDDGFQGPPQIRAVASDRYKVLDNGSVLKAMLTQFEAMGITGWVQGTSIYVDPDRMFLRVVINHPDFAREVEVNGYNQKYQVGFVVENGTVLNSSFKVGLMIHGGTCFNAIRLQHERSYRHTTSLVPNRAAQAIIELLMDMVDSENGTASELVREHLDKVAEAVIKEIKNPFAIFKKVAGDNEKIEQALAQGLVTQGGGQQVHSNLADELFVPALSVSNALSYAAHTATSNALERDRLETLAGYALESSERTLRSMISKTLVENDEVVD